MGQINQFLRESISTTPSSPRGVTTSSGSLRSRWARKDSCLPTAWHLFRCKAQDTSPPLGSAAIDLDNQNTVCPLALAGEFHLFLPSTHHASCPHFRKALFRNVHWGGRAAFRQIRHCVCVYFYDNGTPGELAFLAQAAFKRRRHRRSLFRTFVRIVWEPEMQPPYLASA